MTATTDPRADLLRVAFPRARNTQQTPKNDATARATGAQHMGLKALALLALARNKPRNNDAQEPEKAAQQQGKIRGSVVARFPAPQKDDTRAHLLTLAADELLDAALVNRLTDADLAACEGCTDPELRAYLHALAQSERMAAGIVPPSYTVAAQCSGCGPVWLWPGAPAHVIACPWCFRRAAGRWFPRPPVTCGDCQHFQPDPINPPAGSGTCGLGLPYRRGEAGRYPMARRQCGEFRPVIAQMKDLGA